MCLSCREFGAIVCYNHKQRESILSPPRSGLLRPDSMIVIPCHSNKGNMFSTPERGKETRFKDSWEGVCIVVCVYQDRGHQVAQRPTLL